MLEKRFMAVLMSLVLVLGLAPSLAYAVQGDGASAGYRLATAGADDVDEDDDADDPDEAGDGDDDDESDDVEDEFADGGDGEEGDDLGEEGEDVDIEDAVVTGISGWVYDGKSHASSMKLDVKLNGVSLPAKSYVLYFQDDDLDELDPSEVVDAGTYSVYAEAVEGSGYDGITEDFEFTVQQADNPLKVFAKAKTVKLKAKALKKGGLVSNVKVQNAKGAVAYRIAIAGKNAKAAKKSIKIDGKKGTIKVAKSLKKGAYPVTVTASTKGDRNFKKTSASVSFTIQVK